MTNHNIYGGMTLKALLENPDLQHAPASLSGAPKQKVKKSGDGTTESLQADFTSAFLGPQLWNKTYNAGDFNLEYMDLDEFLSENLGDIPVLDDQGLENLVTSSPTSPLPLSPGHNSSGLRFSPPHSPQSAPRAPPSPVSVHTLAVPPITVTDPSHFLTRPKVETVEEASASTRATSPSAVSTGSTPPVSPLPVHVDFSLTEQDIALSSVPGQIIFDPTRQTFTEDDLKPQPMIKKSKKIFVPEDMKDDKYWCRRKKNNTAAKRSRDARRIKENQIAMRASYLEKENGTLREEMEKIRRENARLKHRLSKYESSA